MSYKAKVINDMGKFLVVGDTINLSDHYNMWLTHVGIYNLVNADLVPKYQDGIRWFERKQGVPNNKSYKVNGAWIHVDFSNIKQNN